MARRRYPVRKAPPKPTEPPCEFCDGAYWRWNGQDWYSSDPITRKRHVCQSPQALRQREVAEAERGARTQARAPQQQKSRRIAFGFKTLAVAAVLALAGYGLFTSKEANPPNGPSDNTPNQLRYAPVDTPTAKCNDGTLSYSANRSGTCSWHGGVAFWYD
jgi:hypothetical protein